jgi:Flp pilus assembly protein TadG
MISRRPVCSEKTTPARRGVLTMELVLTLPILMMVLLGLFEFTLLFYARGMVVEASRAGARQASLPGATLSDVENRVRAVLSPKFQSQLKIEGDLGQRSGDVVFVSVGVPMAAASPDLLWMVGFGLNDQQLYSETRMVRE